MTWYSVATDNESPPIAYLEAGSDGLVKRVDPGPEADFMLDYLVESASHQGTVVAVGSRLGYDPIILEVGDHSPSDDVRTVTQVEGFGGIRGKYKSRADVAKGGPSASGVTSSTDEDRKGGPTLRRLL